MTSFARGRVDDWKKRLVGFGADGAAVNFGKDNGVQALLKRDIAYLIALHCVAHRAERGLVDSLKELDKLKALHQNLKWLYKHYKFSPKALHELRLVAEALEEKVLKPTNLAGARFLPYIHKANKIVCESYAVFVTYFQDLISTERRPKPSPKVRGRAYRILTFLMDYDNVLFSYFMRDTFEALSELSLNFQKDSLTVCDAVEALETCSLKLVDLQFQPTEGMQEVIDAVSKTGLFRGTKLKYVNEGQILFLRKKVIDVLIKHLEKRFQDLQKGSVPSKLSIFNPSQWPSDRQELADICEHYQPLMDEHSVTTKMLKSEFILYKSYAAARTLRMPQIFSGILCDTERCKQYKGLSILFEIYLVLAVNTTVCERGFSCMKRVKNDWRSCLGTEQLSRLMFSSIEGPSMDNFDAAGAVEKWWTSGNRARRPGFNPWQKEQEQEIRDDLYEDLVLMDQEAEQEENVRQEAISDELGLEAENVAAGEKRLAEALDDSDESDIDESDIDTFLKDY
ncbi:E3 SUMO-protein ligase KIAA1586-like [Gymnodraco acuticeps]|uniref:E3 SUMO-protein ligase KIAA1586-like n=1 Tax=Gymnodraco acuticeps TaxID=8218 RepID=A0A6P8TA38_GYMAC|nr:E3 SUMO-protein ligase KIAA1586-like [Gymnodraco acuticeps]